MLIRKPKYFDEFKCIAGECPKTCCAGWAVVVDDSTREKYNAMEGALGQRIRNEMKEDDGDIIFPLRDGRCPFLNDANLCDIQAATDEATLCKTCRMFPRFEHEFGLTREKGLSLSCPEAARLIMSAECMELVAEQTDEGITQYNDIDPELYMRLTKLRGRLFEALQNEEVSLDEKAEEILSVAACLAGEKEKEINNKLFVERCLRTCQKFESIDEGWEKIRRELKDLWGTELSVIGFAPESEEKRELENILFYYVYRYFLSAVLEERYEEDIEGLEGSEENDDAVDGIEEVEDFNANVVGKLLISVFCFYIIVSVYVIRQPKTAAERMELVCDISREVEHSQINLDIVEKEMAKAIKEC